MEGKPMFSLHKTRGGVHPPQCKDMRDFACTSITPPERVLIPLNMHIGAPAKPVVSEGDHVYVGTLIGQVEGLGSPIHASISGTVAKVATEQLPTGATAPVVEIVSDGKMESDPELKAPEYRTKEEFISCVRDSGMVGLGGASFPTWFKMRAPEGKSFEFLVVNGMECEPYITSDYRQMMEHTERVIDGVFRTIEALEIPAAVIGVEDNKPEAILELQRVVKEKGREDRIEVMSIPTKYPAGGEKVLIKATTGRDVPAGGLPIDVGCLVVNVTPGSIVDDPPDLVTSGIGQLSLAVQIGFDLVDHFLLHFLAVAVDELDAVIVVRVVAGGNHDPAIELIHFGDIGDARGRCHMHQAGVGAGSCDSRRQGTLKHITGPAGVFADHDLGFMILAVIPTKKTAHLESMVHR